MNSSKSVRLSSARKSPSASPSTRSAPPTAPILRATRTSARVPSLRLLSTLSSAMLARYRSAKSSILSILSAAHPVARRIAVSSARGIGCASTGKNMFACSAESQSLSGREREAVAMRRKEGCARVSSPLASCNCKENQSAEARGGRRHKPQSGWHQRRCASHPTAPPHDPAPVLRGHPPWARSRLTRRDVRVVPPMPPPRSRYTSQSVFKEGRERTKRT